MGRHVSDEEYDDLLSERGTMTFIAGPHHGEVLPVSTPHFSDPTSVRSADVLCGRMRSVDFAAVDKKVVVISLFDAEDTAGGEPPHELCAEGEAKPGTDDVCSESGQTVSCDGVIRPDDEKETPDDDGTATADEEKQDEEGSLLTEVATNIMLNGGVCLVLCAPQRKVKYLKHYWDERSDSVFIAIPLVFFSDVSIHRKFEDGGVVDLVYSRNDAKPEGDAEATEIEPVDPSFAFRRALFCPAGQRTHEMQEVIRNRMTAFRRCFHQLTDADVENLCHSVHHRWLPANAVVYAQGTTHDSCYIVGVGSVKIIGKDCEDKLLEPLSRTLVSGGYFGELGVVREDGVRPCDAIAGPDGVDLMVITRGGFQDMVQERRLKEVLEVLEKGCQERSMEEQQDLLCFLGLASGRGEHTKELWHRPNLVLQSPMPAISRGGSWASVRRASSLFRTASHGSTSSANQSHQDVGVVQDVPMRFRRTSSRGSTAGSAWQCHEDLGFLRNLPISVRMTLVTLFKARSIQPGELVCEESVSNDALHIVLHGECTVEGGPLHGEKRSKGMCWGLKDEHSRTSVVTVRALTKLHIMELSRLDYVSARAAPEQSHLEKRLNVFKSRILRDTSIPDQVCGTLLVQNFRSLRFPQNTAICTQSDPLDVLKGVGGHVGDFPQTGSTQHREAADNWPVSHAGADSALTLKDLYLDFVVQGSIQLIRKAEFSPAQGSMSGKASKNKNRQDRLKLPIEAIPIPVYKNLALLELSEGDCYTALDIYGGQDRWTCSAVASSDVEILRISITEFRHLVTAQRMKDLEKMSLRHNKSRADTLSQLANCHASISIDGGCNLRGNDIRLFSDMALPLSLQKLSKARLQMIRPLDEKASTIQRPQTARAKITAFQSAPGKTKVAVAAETTPGHPLKQAATRIHLSRMRLRDHFTEEQDSSYIPITRLETTRTRERTRELAIPNPRKQAVPREVNRLWDKKTKVAATWCSPTLPQFGGTVYMCKLKVKLGYPVYCPFQIKYGGVYNLPFLRLDDILAGEARAEFNENVKRRQVHAHVQ